MKKIGLFITLLFSSFIFMGNVNASSATISAKSSASTVVVGNLVTVTVTVSSASPLGSWEYSLNYDSSLMTFISSDYSLHYAGVANNASTKSVSYKYKFKAKSAGSARFYLSASEVLGWDESNMSVTTSQSTVKVITQAELEAGYSKDNYLKALSIDGYSIDPIFNKDTLNYSLTVEPDVKSIKVSATKSDTKASVSGVGEQSLTEGANKISIVVTAENGITKTYIITVTVKELTPINLTYNNITYSVIRDLDISLKPSTYDQKTITINEEEVPAFYNEVTDYTLIGLKDSEGNQGLYLYLDGNIQNYQELSIGNLSIRVLPINKEYKNYHKYNETINELSISVLKLNKNNKVSLIHGINLDTNEDSYYSYNSNEDTLQKYYVDEIKILNKDIKDYQMIICAFGGALFILVIIFLVSKRHKQPKKEKKNKEKTIIDEKD